MWKSCLLIAIAVASAGSRTATPDAVHVDGDKARQLISILVTGSAESLGIADPGQSYGIAELTAISVRDLRVLAASTQKFDEHDARHKLDIYKAWGNVEGARRDMGEAIALWNLLQTFGVKAEPAMEGSYLEVARLDCRISPEFGISDARRFSCDIGGFN